MTRERVVEYTRVRAGDLIRHPKNWRRHPESQQRALRVVLDRVGNVAPLVTFRMPDGNLCLIDGHLRADIRPDEEVEVAVTDLTPEEADLVLVTFDPISSLAEVDEEKLSLLKKSVDFSGLEDVLQALDKLSAETQYSQGSTVHQQSSHDDSDSDLDIEEWHVSQGQVWEILSQSVSGQSHRVICGDCRDKSMVRQAVGDRDVVVAFTSPPYAAQRGYDPESGFSPIPPEKYLDWFSSVQENVRDVLAQDGSWFVNIKEHTDRGQRHIYVKDLVIAHVRQWGWWFIDEFCWIKNTIPLSVHGRFKNGWEPVFHFAQVPAGKIRFHPKAVSVPSDNIPHPPPGESVRYGESGNVEVSQHVVSGMARPSNVITARDYGKSNHPAAFPLSLPMFFIRAFSDLGDLIFDPFLGSGTTLFAAEECGRICSGIEISPKYLAVILSRAKNRGLRPVLVS